MRYDQREDGGVSVNSIDREDWSSVEAGTLLWLRMLPNIAAPVVALHLGRPEFLKPPKGSARRGVPGQHLITAIYCGGLGAWRLKFVDQRVSFALQASNKVRVTPHGGP